LAFNDLLVWPEYQYFVLEPSIKDVCTKLPPLFQNGALAQADTWAWANCLLARADTPKISKKFEVFCSKNFRRPHLNKPPSLSAKCPHWTKPPDCGILL